jgi:hypothetical protein
MFAAAPNALRSRSTTIFQRSSSDIAIQKRSPSIAAVRQEEVRDVLDGKFVVLFTTPYVFIPVGK